jgi:hypothetical protein
LYGGVIVYESSRAGFGMKCILKLNLWIVLVLSVLTSNMNHAQKGNITVEEWEKRLNRLQPPKDIMDAIGLKPGMVIGEIGSGTGRMTVWLADRGKGICQRYSPAVS